MKSTLWKMQLFFGLCFIFIGLTRLLVKDTLGFIVFALIALLWFVISFLSYNSKKK